MSVKIVLINQEKGADMRYLLLFLAVFCLSLGLEARGVTWGFSQTGGHFVIGGGYKHPAYGSRVNHRDPYARSGGHGYMQGAHHSTKQSCGYGGSGCCQSASHGQYAPQAYAYPKAQTILQCDANNANCQEIKLFFGN